MRHILAGHPLGIWLAIFALPLTLLIAGGGQVLSLVTGIWRSAWGYRSMIAKLSTAPNAPGGGGDQS